MLVAKIAVAGAVMVAMTVGADAAKRSAHRGTGKKATVHVVATAYQPVETRYVYRYHGGPKGYMWPEPAH